MTRRSLVTIVVLVATLALAVGLWPYDCRAVLQLTSDVVGGADPNLVAVQEHRACSSISGFTWSQSPLVSITILLGSVLLVTLATFLVWRHRGRG